MAMNSAFFSAVRDPLYGGKLNQVQVDSLNAIGDAWDDYGDGDNRKLAYILATAHHETGRFQWRREIWGPTKQQAKYEGRADLGNVQAGDGKKFMGRSSVQLTARRNYADWSRRPGIDLVKEPDLVLKPEIARASLCRVLCSAPLPARSWATTPPSRICAASLMAPTKPI